MKTSLKVRAGFVVAATAAALCRCVYAYFPAVENNDGQLKFQKLHRHLSLSFRRISKREILNCTARIRFYI
jgi:hypothetical protein